MPKNLKLGFVFVLFLSACGATAAEVAVGPAPVKTTAAANLSDDENDMNAFDELGLFLAAANAADHAQIRTVTVPGIKLLAAGQESVGRATMRLSVTTAGVDGDLGVAVRSGSGTCPWYAVVEGESRFGSGEPCTGTSALNRSTTEMSADSPFHLVFDAEVARSAQSSLRIALVAAKTYYSDSGTFESVTPAILEEIEPGLIFVAADSPSADSDTVSIAVVGNPFGAAGDERGRHLLLDHRRLGSPTKYGQGTPCTGMAALAATGSAWD